MFILNGKRINIHAPFTTSEGVTYGNLTDPSIRQAVGVIEVPDPVYPDPELFYWTENEDGSLTVTPKDPLQVAQARLKKCEVAVQAILDSKAKDYGYDDIKSAVTYAEEPSVPKFQKDGQAFRAWRSKVWSKCYEIIDQFNAGTIALPSVDDVIGQLPAFVEPV